MSQLFDLPARLSGNAREDAPILYGYLYRLAEQLNHMARQLDAGAADAAQGSAQEGARGAGSASEAVPAETAEGYNQLRSLILKSGETIRSYMDAVVEAFRGEYVTKSEYGSFLQNLETVIETTAEGMLYDFHFDSALDALNAEMAGFDSYRVRTEQYIRVGIIDYLDDGTPVTGILVGNNLRQVEIDGRKYTRSQEVYGAFTADALTFYKNGQRVAWFSNERLNVTDVAVRGKMTLDLKWQIENAHGLTLKWIGG